MRLWIILAGIVTAFLMSVVIVIALDYGLHTDTRTTDEVLARAVVDSLADACPFGDDPADEVARDACANRLAGRAVLRSAMVEPFIWGGQRPAGGYALDKGTTRFNARVWRKLYASTFMYGAEATIERVGEQTIAHVPVRFRGAMQPGAYPYPFWHSEKKWDAYNFATTIHLVFERGKWIGALRGAAQDTARPKTARAWDGAWHWQQDGHGMPYVSLYRYAFSPDNPSVTCLDDAFRALEGAMRKQRCATCHAPDNRGKADQLELLVYPAQALGARHDIVAQLEDDTMPPADEHPAGIADAAEHAQLLTLARDFASAGDVALAWEGEPAQ